MWQVQTKNSSLFFQILWDGCGFGSFGRCHRAGGHGAVSFHHRFRKGVALLLTQGSGKVEWMPIGFSSGRLFPWARAGNGKVHRDVPAKQWRGTVIRETLSGQELNGLRCAGALAVSGRIGIDHERHRCDSWAQFAD